MPSCYVMSIACVMIVARREAEKRQSRAGFPGLGWRRNCNFTHPTN